MNMHNPLVETVHDERDPRLTTIRQRELIGIVKKGGVKVMQKATLQEFANIIGNRFMLTIKEPGTSDPIYKAQWIL